MRTSRNLTIRVVALLTVGVAATAAGCAAPKTTNSAASPETKITKFLTAPDSAVPIPPTPAPPVTSPLTGSSFVLPYTEAFPVPDGPIGNPNKTYTVCFSQALIRHPFPVAQRASLKIEAARHPNLKVLYYNTDNDPLKQIQDLKTCASQNPDVILVWPHSVAPLTPVIKQLMNDGNKVIGMERTVATSNYTSWIYLNTIAETEGLATGLIEDIGKRGVIAETTGAVGSSPEIVRSWSFRKALKQKGANMNIVTTSPTDYSESSAYSVALQFLGSPKADKLDAWFAHSTTIALGIAKAMNDRGVTGIPIYTIDNTKRGTKAVANGKIEAIAPHSPLHGGVALRIAIWEIEGKKVPKDVKLGPQPLITEENAKQRIDSVYGPLQSGNDK